MGVEVAVPELFGLGTGRRGGQLGVGDAAVAGEAAAGRRGGDVDVLGEGLGEGSQPRRQAQATGRAGRVDGGGADLLADLEPGQQAVVGPGDRVEDLQIGESLGVLLAEDALAGFGDGVGAGGGVDHDR